MLNTKYNFSAVGGVPSVSQIGKAARGLGFHRARTVARDWQWVAPWTMRNRHDYAVDFRKQELHTVSKMRQFINFDEKPFGASHFKPLCVNIEMMLLCLL